MKLGISSLNETLQNKTQDQMEENGGKEQMCTLSYVDICIKLH